MQTIPVLPIRGLPVFPYMIIHFDVGRQGSIRAVEEAMLENQLIFLVAQRAPELEKPTQEDLFEVGTISRIKQILKLPGNEIRVLVEGISRARGMNLRDLGSHFECEVVEEMDYSEHTEEENITQDAYIRKIKNQCIEYFGGQAKSPNESVHSFLAINDPARFSDLVAANLFVGLEDKQALLEEFSVQKRLELLVDILTREIGVQAVERTINARVKEQLDKHQRDYYLREQIKVIQDELGNGEDVNSEIDEYLNALEQAGAPDEVLQKAEKELSRLYQMQPGNPEGGVIRNYVEWLISIPWVAKTEENRDIRNAEKILERDHYGMKKVKERVVEFLAVHQLAEGLKSPILCLVGPPGVGKTSIAKSIASALGRNYVRMSLGGVRDEAEIRGHRRTYIGAMPGRIISAMKQAGSKNPLILLDEIDKMGADFKGDPSSALLEVLDAEQNGAFRDHFIELPVDLSEVMFVTTANSLDPIDRPLLDRMEVIEVSGYTEDEKTAIATGYLIPKQLKEHGLKKANLRMGKNVIGEIINSYTKESGVRQLERRIAKIMRRVARLMVSDGRKSVTVNLKNLEQFLGKRVYSYNRMNERDEVGVATGLAWTPFGGDTLSIEVNCMPGTGKVELTGSLGDVMKESARAAISFIRSRADVFGVDADFHKNTDIHIHVPEGATPKDGPSAGITMATALVSALTGKPVSKRVAMTGEITLRGRILPIGGLKEKSLAAYRAGIRTVLIPAENKRDLDELPKEIRDQMEFVIADSMETVLKTALVQE